MAAPFLLLWGLKESCYSNKRRVEPTWELEEEPLALAHIGITGQISMEKIQWSSHKEESIECQNIVRVELQISSSFAKTSSLETVNSLESLGTENSYFVCFTAQVLPAEGKKKCLCGLHFWHFIRKLDLKPINRSSPVSKLVR